MPTYVYECKSCAKVFERWQSISEPPVVDCDCGATGTVKRVMQPVGIAFRGEGFHINDYSAKPAETTETKETKAEPKSETVEAPAVETKTETPAPSPAPAKTEAPAS